MPARARQVDPNPRDPGTSSSSAPSRPRPPRDPQPRDDGASRSMRAALASMTLSDTFSSNLVLMGDPEPEGPNPRDPGKKKRLALRRSDDDDDGESGASPRDPGRSAALSAAAASAAARGRPLSSGSQRSPQTPNAAFVLFQQPRDAGY